VNKLPNFFLIGAAKCGTTSLASYLEQHPDVFICPTKEPNYFALTGRTLPHPGPASPAVLQQLIYADTFTDFDQYQALFAGVRGEKAVGEASVRYIYYPETAARIHQRIPNARLVAVLREPVARLYSHYCMNVQYQLEPLPLLEAVAAEDERRAANWGWDWHYVNLGLYSRQLRRYFETFAREQIKVFLYDDFVAKPQEVYADICRHLGVDPGFVPDMSQRGKVPYWPKHLGLDRWLHWPHQIRPGIGRFIPRRLPRAVVSRLEQWNSVPIPKLDKSVHRQLAGRFHQEARELEELLGRKIPWYA
jgi:Sulfotransferase family